MDSLLFLYGEYRSFKTAVKTWNILNRSDLDIVVHTPTTTSDFLGNINFTKIKNSDFNELCNPKIFLHDRNEYKKTDLHVLHYSYRFLSEYLKSSKKYKYIFICRLDSTFYIHDLNSLIDDSRDDLFVQQLPQKDYFIPDHTFFGKYDIVKRFVDNLPSSDYLVNSHQDMGIYLTDMDFKLSTWYGFESIHIRPNMVDRFEMFFQGRDKIKNIDESYLKFYQENNSLFIKLDNQYKENEK